MIFPWLNNLSGYFSSISSIKESAAKLLRPLIITSLLVTSGTLGVRYLGFMEAAELAAYDQLIQQQPLTEADDRLLVVGITENDLQTLQEWPISDRALARAISQLQQHGPQTIAIDVFRDFPHPPGTEAFLAQLQQNPDTLVICKASSTNDLGIPPPPGIAMEQVGFADLVVDPGGILRRSLLMTGLPEPETPFPKQHMCNQTDQTLLSLSFRATMRYLAAKGIQADFTEDQQLIFGASTVIPQIQPHMGGYQGADTNGYQIMLYYRAAKQAIREVSLMEVLNGEVDPDLIRDRIIFIGYTTPQANDDFYTPYSVSKDDNQKMPGVIVHAQSTSQLISTVLDGRPLIWAWPNSVEILWLLVWSLGGGILGWYSRHPLTFALVIFTGLGALYSVCLLTLTQGGWIPLIPPTFTFVGTAVGVVLLDRFSHSEYGQRVYRNVKSFLHIEIEIDEEKLEKQITEITETDYFQDLQSKAKGIRKRSQQTAQKISTNTTWAHNYTAPAWEPDADDIADSAPNVTAFAADSERSKNGALPSAHAKPHSKPHLGSPSQANQVAEGHLVTPAIKPDNAEELDFIQQLNSKAKRLKPNLGANNFQSDERDRLPTSQAVNRPAPQPQISVTPTVARHHPPFNIDSTFCEYVDTSAETEEHLTYLAAKAAALQTEIQAHSQETP